MRPALPLTLVFVALLSTVIMETRAGSVRPDCLRDQLRAEKGHEEAFSATTPELLRDAAHAKGLNADELAEFMELLNRDPLADSGRALAIVEKLKPEKLKSKSSRRLLAYAIRGITNSPDSGVLSAAKAAEALNTWTDLEVAGLARFYDRANRVEKGVPAAQRAKALQTALEEDGLTAEEAKQLALCAKQF